MVSGTGALHSSPFELYVAAHLMTTTVRSSKFDLGCKR